MSLIELVKSLQEEGVEIEFRKRKDGGIIVKRINGERYSGARGNARIREISGATLSEARIKQTAYNVQRYIKGKRKNKQKLSDDLLKELKKVQRLMRKTKAKGHVTKRQLKHQFYEGGRRQAKEYLAKMSRYATGLAYEENVDFLADRIKALAESASANKMNRLNTRLKRLANKVERAKSYFKEEWIEKVNGKLYDIEHAMFKEKDELKALGYVSEIEDLIS